MIMFVTGLFSMLILPTPQGPGLASYWSVGEYLGHIISSVTSGSSGVSGLLTLDTLL